VTTSFSTIQEPLTGSSTRFIQKPQGCCPPIRLSGVGEIKGTRELVIPGTPYIVAYRVIDDQIEILFVQHGARKWPDEI